MNQSTRRGVLYALIAYAAWGLLAPVGQILLRDLPPLGLNALRMVIATAMVVVLMPKGSVAGGIALLRDKRLLLLILIGGGIDFTLYTYALTRLDATFATLGFYTAPLWTALLARPLLGEHVGKWFLPAVAVMLGGAYFALVGAGGGLATLAGIDPLGMALAVGAGAGWGIYAVGLRKIAVDAPLSDLTIAWFVVTCAYFVGFGWLVEGPVPIAALDVAAWGWMLLYAALPTTLAIMLFNGALQRAPAGLVNILVGVELVSTVAFSWLLLGDTFDSVQMLGIAAVIAAVSAYLWARK